MSAAEPPLFFYGDDFTGSSDVIGQYFRSAVKTILFVRVPSLEQLRACVADGYRAIGIAGTARALPSAMMEAEIRPAFEAFRALGARLVQYKVCSTFDSSPHTGNIGRAIEIARSVCGPARVVVAPAQPQFGRYTLFANHFAKAPGGVFRLDRHPTMSSHPSTPMHESDLTVLLGEQAGLRCTLVDINAVREGVDTVLGAMRAAAHDCAVVVDALTDDDLATLARALRTSAREAMTVIVGSGGISFGLGKTVPADAAPNAAAESETLTTDADGPMLVVSGSRSAQTHRQLAWAEAHGFAFVYLDPLALLAASSGLAAVEDAVRAVCAELARERDTVVTLDPRVEVEAMLAAAARADIGPEGVAALIGTALGAVVERALASGAARTGVVCGGDTSSYAVRRMEVTSLEPYAIADVAATLCRVRSPHLGLEGATLVLKGGQVGSDDLFAKVKRLRSASPSVTPAKMPRSF